MRLFLSFFFFLVIFPLIVHAEPVLSDQQVQIFDTDYQNVLKQLSPEGQKDFERGQKEWRVFVDKFCSKENLSDYNTIDECIQTKYLERENSLGDVIYISKNGMVIRRAEHFDTHNVDMTENTSWVEANHGRKSWTSETAVYWPQIDNPVTEGQKNWNKFSRNLVYFDDEVEGRHCNLSNNYKVVFVTPDVISVKFSNGWYCPGAAHGSGGEALITRSLSLDRPFKAEDIFINGVDVAPKIKELAIKSLNDQGKDGLSLEGRDDLTKNYSNPEHWGFTEKGITINFGSVNGYANGQYIAEISWEDLKPYLKTPSIFLE